MPPMALSLTLLNMAAKGRKTVMAKKAIRKNLTDLENTRLFAISLHPCALLDGADLLLQVDGHKAVNKIIGGVVVDLFWGV